MINAGLHKANYKLSDLFIQVVLKNDKMAAIYYYITGFTYMLYMYRVKTQTNNSLYTYYSNKWSDIMKPNKL